VDPERELGEEPGLGLGEPEGDPGLIEAVQGHASKFLGSSRLVYHEAESRFAHIDLHRFGPDEEYGFHTFVTSGMAIRPMNVPREVENPEAYRYAELVLHLPENWPLDWVTLQKVENWWPLEVLTSLARLPHEREGWVWGGHTLRNGEPPEPYSPDTELSAALVLPSYLMPDEFEVLEMEDGREIVFLTVAFLHPDELEYSVRHGSDALLDRVEESGTSLFEFLVLDRSRRSACS
jgi:hypothetical protein